MSILFLTAAIEYDAAEALDILGTFGEIVPPSAIEERMTAMGMASVLLVGAAGAVLATAARTEDSGLRALGFMYPRSWMPLAAGAIIFAATASIVLPGIVWFAPNLLVYAKLPSDPAARHVTMISLLAIAPICEELFYRGFIYGNLRARLSPWATNGVTAVVSAAAHIDGTGYYPVIVFAVSLLFGWLREVSDSLWPAIILHSIVNLVALAVVAIWIA